MLLGRSLGMHALPRKAPKHICRSARRHLKCTVDHRLSRADMMPVLCLHHAAWVEIAVWNAYKSFFSSSRASSCSTKPSSPKQTLLKAPSCPSMLPGCIATGTVCNGWELQPSCLPYQSLQSLLLLPSSSFLKASSLACMAISGRPTSKMEVIRSMPVGADQSATVPKLLTVFHTCKTGCRIRPAPNPPRTTPLKNDVYHVYGQHCEKVSWWPHIRDGSWDDSARPDLHMRQWRQ